MKAFVRTALVMAALGLGAAMAALPTPSLGARAIPNDADVAEFTIMGHRFRVPKVYLSGLQKVIERTSEYKGDSVHMRAVMPDLILARVYDLVCSFLVACPARELTVNHCD